jgi:hypothetical protein
MKILILVLSCLDEPYYSLMKKQQDTWDSVENENIRTIYYYGKGGGFKKIKENSYEYGAECPDSFKMMYRKFYLLLKEIINDDWDYIFRTNSSSYVDKENLLKFMQNLPSKNGYGGVSSQCVIENSIICFVSGAGIFLSKDAASVIVNSDYSSDEESISEDVYIGKILNNKDIYPTFGAQRVDLDSNHYSDLNTYHFRCSSNTDRQIDLDRMEEIYEKMKR